MEVILLANTSVGKAGSIVKVKDGYARNFLLPNRLALPVTSENLKKFEQDKLARQAEYDKVKKAAEDLLSKIAVLSLTIPVLTQGETELYGSVTAQEISKVLKDEGFEIDKSMIHISEPIKAVGIYEVPVKLHPDVSGKVKLWIVKK